MAPEFRKCLMFSELPRHNRILSEAKDTNDLNFFGG
jgi:hypothetical protein